MTTPEKVLAWVVPRDLWETVTTIGIAYEAHSEEDAREKAEHWDVSCPGDAPHTVRQLAEVVAVVDTAHVLHVACSLDSVAQMARESRPVTISVTDDDNGFAQFVFTEYTPPVVTINDAMVERAAKARYSQHHDDDRAAGLVVRPWEDLPENIRAVLCEDEHLILTAALGEAPGPGARPTAQGA